MLFTKKDAPERLFLCSRMNGMPQGGRKPVWLCSRMRRTDICSCNICTSTIPGGRMPQGGRMAVRIFLFCFTSLLAISNTVWAEPACPADSFDETTTVRYIHDGDTLHLKDGRKVRLIGINTPEGQNHLIALRRRKPGSLQTNTGTCFQFRRHKSASCPAK